MAIMKKLIAYCGLDCENCDARKATLKNDDALREKTARLWSKMNGEKILPEMINCEGCRADSLIPRRSARNFVANASEGVLIPLFNCLAFYWANLCKFQ